MQWVAKRYIPATLLLIALVSGALVSHKFSEVDLLPHIQPLTCADNANGTLRVTVDEECPGALSSLGDAPLTESATARAGATEIHPILLARFEAAKAAAALVGVNLYITSGFRDEKRQAVLFARAIEKYGSETEAAKWVLPAAFSHHPDGLAIDINYPGDLAGAQWLEKNGERYGLCRVYANEWWHFEGVIAPGQFCPAMAPNALVDLS